MGNRISREYMFSAAHRIEGHPKCGRLHGHNYVVRVILIGRLDEHGMVLDYGEMDKAIKPMLDRLDHMYLVSLSNIKAGCEYAIVAQRKGEAFDLGIQHSTAEGLAQLIHSWVWIQLSWKAENIEVEVIETPKSSATFTME